MRGPGGAAPCRGLKLLGSRARKDVRALSGVRASRTCTLPLLQEGGVRLRAMASWPAPDVRQIYDAYLARQLHLRASTVPDRPSENHNDWNSLDDEFRVVHGSLKLRCYGRSRGAALVIARLTTFENHEEDITRLIDTNLAEPPDFDYGQATFEELRVAIEEVWRQMRDRGNAGVDDIWSTLPFCRVVTRVVHSLEVAIIVQPLPPSGAANSPAPPCRGDTSASSPAIQGRSLIKKRTKATDTNGPMLPCRPRALPSMMPRPIPAKGTTTRWINTSFVRPVTLKRRKSSARLRSLEPVPDFVAPDGPVPRCRLQIACGAKEP